MQIAPNGKMRQASRKVGRLSHFCCKLYAWGFQTFAIPSIPSLVKICDAFQITLSEFFAKAEGSESAPVVLTPQQEAVLNLLNCDYAPWASILLRGGLTLLNLTARSGVVSGQSASNVIGIFFAASSSASSSFVNASSCFSSIDISLVFTIIKPPFKFGSHSCRNQSCHICFCTAFFNSYSFSMLL